MSCFSSGVITACSSLAMICATSLWTVKISSTSCYIPLPTHAFFPGSSTEQSALPYHHTFESSLQANRIHRVPCIFHVAVLSVSRYCSTEVRAKTLRSLIFDRWSKIASIAPSARYCLSGSSLKYLNGSTAMDLLMIMASLVSIFLSDTVKYMINAEATNHQCS